MEVLRKVTQKWLKHFTSNSKIVHYNDVPVHIIVYKEFLVTKSVTELKYAFYSKNLSI